MLGTDFNIEAALALTNKKRKRWILYLCILGNNMSSMFADDLFSHKGTAAWHVANDESRQDYKTLETEDALFLCAAFYERKELFSNKKADEIIVVGFGRDRVRDAVAIFNAGAAA